jgi:ligand-binding sensor domain-containing protein
MNKLSLPSTIVLFFLCQLFATSGFGQIAYRFRHLGIQDGLSQGSIYNMYKDSRGFLWLGTQDGINRFDGKTVNVYLSGSTGESTNVLGITEDSASNLWVGSHKGFYKYIRSRDKFIKSSFGKSLENVSVHVFSDRNKNIYLLAENGLYKVVDQAIMLVTKALSYNRSQYNNFIAESPEGDFWILNPQKGLIRFAVGTRKISEYFSENPQSIWGQPETFSCISFDKNGNLWLGGKTGLTKFDYNRNSVKRYDPDGNSEKYSLSDITEDKNGLLWVATEGNGIYIFDKEKEKLVQHIRHEADISNSLRFDEVSKILIDEHNDVFVNTDPQGLDIITGVSSAFSYYTYGKNPEYNLSDYSIRGLAEDSNSKIWVGTELGGMNLLDPETGKIKRYITKDGLPGNIIRYVIKDQNQKIWVATLNGLAVFTPESNRFKQINLPVSCEIASLLPLDENLLLITSNKGLFLFQTKTQKVVDALYPDFVAGYTTYMDSLSRQIYIADRYRGVNIFSFRENKLVLKNRILENFNVLHFYHENAGNFLWVSTAKGLIKWNIRQNVIVKNYRVEDGLHHEFIYSALPDKSGHFFLSTNKGLTWFDPATERFNFIKGIPAREYNSRASLITKNGDLYFGSTTGLDRIRPEKFALRVDEVGVQLTEILYDQPGEDQDSTYIGEVNTLQLPFNSNTVTLKFTSIDYRSGGINQYRYFLKGYDQDTVYSGTNNQVRYARLPAGKYEFQLQASDGGGKWVSPVRKLSIQILPPFWQTWWFIVGTLVLAGIIVYFSVKGYLNSKLNDQRIESDKKIALEKERSRIARDMNDSLGSEIFGLKLLGQMTLSQSKEDGSESNLKKMVAISKSISEKISEVIWLTDSNQDHTESLWNYIQKYALIYLKPSGIKYHFYELAPNQAVRISGERRHEILNFNKLLFSELTKTSDIIEAQLSFKIFANSLFVSVSELHLDLMDKTLFENLARLGGSRISDRDTDDILMIPLDD